MKTVFTFLLSVAYLPQLLSAQPTVSQNEYYIAGDVITMVNVNPPATTDTPGANITWNFSALSPSGGNSITTVANNASGVFSTSNLMITLPGGDIEFASVTGGSGGNSYVNGIYYPMGYSPGGGAEFPANDTVTYTAYDIARRPFTYLGYYLDTYKIDGASPVITGNGRLTITGDSYGTLILPGDTFTNILRIRKFQTETDTVGGTEFPVVTTIKYQWFDTIHNAPLFEVDSTLSFSGAVATAMYLVTGTEGVFQANAATPFRYTGYIQNDQLQLTGSFDNGHTYNVVVYSIIGTKIYTGDFTASGNTQRMDMGRSISPGIYIVSLTQPSNTSFSQVIKVVKQS